MGSSAHGLCGHKAPVRHAPDTEDGVDRRFLQQQVGHECDSSLAIYTHVSDDFMNTSLRKALAPAFAGA
ncbi:hypothetical protein [Streptomyces sp. ME19-01-6]|uniref:hypothetical protein n=1 Tax=Streptomyces sp. ME19-01-6 TaxID=3028686 RepID=UPI0039F4A9C9